MVIITLIDRSGSLGAQSGCLHSSLSVIKSKLHGCLGNNIGVSSNVEKKWRCGVAPSQVEDGITLQMFIATKIKIEVAQQEQ